MLDQKTIRKLLMAAVVVALAATPAAAKTAANCESKDSHYGLFCNSGGDIEVCSDGDGACTASCGQGSVDVLC